MDRTDRTGRTGGTGGIQCAGRLIVLAVMGVLGVMGAAAMSMHQQLFLLCVRHAPPAPPLPYDAEVMYLESTGTQLLDTGIHGRDNILFAIRFSLTSFQTSGIHYIFWGLESRLFVGLFEQSSSATFRFAAMSSIISATVPTDTGIHDVTIDTTSYARRIEFDGSEIYSSNGSFAGQHSSTIGLFGRIGYANGSFARIYSFSVRDTSTGQLLLDLIPVRKDGVGYMYDKVSGQLFGNGGTGDFVIGPDK